MLVHLLTLWVTRPESALKRQQRIPASVGVHYKMKPLTNIIILFLALACNAQEKNSVNHDLSLAEAIDSLNIDKSKISVLIDKSDFRLYVRVNEIVIKEYPVVFGKNTVDDI